jgi:hypothetical protein
MIDQVDVAVVCRPSVNPTLMLLADGTNPSELWTETCGAG